MTVARRLGRIGAFGAAALLQVTAAAAEAPAAVVEGVWLTAEKSEMTIARCGEGSCGYITKIVVPDHIIAEYGDELEAIGSDFTDYNNKNPELRSRPIQGLQILSLRPGSNPWHFVGDIYNPQDGNFYAGSVEIVGADSIRLKGCVLYVLCQEQEWTRVLPDAGAVSAD